MGVELPEFPDSFDFDVDLDIVGPIELSGSPTFNIDVKHLPKITLGIDPITINPLTINPLDLTLRWTEAPSIRAHVPADYSVGLSMLGFQLFCIRLCGEAQVITEPYVPNPCEVCGRENVKPMPPPEQPDVPR